MNINFLDVFFITFLICIFIVNIIHYVSENEIKWIRKVKNLELIENLTLGIIFLFLSNLVSDNYVWLFGFIEEFTLFIWSALIYFGILYLMLSILEIYEKFIHLVRKTLNLDYKEEKIQMVFWLGVSNVSDKSLFEIFGDSVIDKYKDTDNLFLLRSKLEEKLGKEIVNYELLKNHLQDKIKDPFLKKIIYLFTTPVIGVIVTFLITNFKDYLDKFKDTFSEIRDFEKINQLFNFIVSIPGVSLILIITVLIYCVYIFSKTVYLVFTDKNRSVKYLISVLDIIINDMKNK